MEKLNERTFPKGIINQGVESKGRCLGCQIGDPSGLSSISVTEVQDYSEKEKSQNRMWEILTIAQLEWDCTCLEWRQLSWYVGFGWPATRHSQMTQCLGFWGKRPFELPATVLSSSNEPMLSHSFLCWATLRSVQGLSGKLLTWLHLSEKHSLVELIFIWPCSSLSICQGLHVLVLRSCPGTKSLSKLGSNPNNVLD